ncbi:mannosyltransferase family protein [Catellatospora sp. KI3]|uniref:mannosyltransferase family protein n=1 Tax=Catellatospora sp. KI3 TaxID=3041620 RepID=UPI002482E8AE|nr:mannosyltransferase family protein [Catellatospora sp. KI3]MDI1465293.1 mannosyltransferase family protein [Catellatospora sp. KI3]
MTTPLTTVDGTAEDQSLPAAAPAPAAPLPGWRDSLRAGLWTWLAGLVGMCVMTYMSYLPFIRVESPSGARPANLLEALAKWSQWDTLWYIRIADSGYGTNEMSTAFFPLYPATVRVVGWVLPGPTIVAALAVSAVCAFGALVLMHRLAVEVLGDLGDAGRSIFYLLAFPTGFFLFAGYNESMFIMLAAGSLYFMRRGRWWAAGALAALSSGTRLVGVMLGVAFVIEYVRQRGLLAGGRPQWRRIRPDVLAAGLVPGGVLAYAAYCWYHFDEPMIFSRVQENWRRETQPPWVTLSWVVEKIADSKSIFDHLAVHNVIALSSVLAFGALLVLALVGPWRLGRENLYLTVFAALCLLVPLTGPIARGTPLTSFVRYALEALPAFMVLAKMGRSEGFGRVYLVSAIGAQSIMLLTFLHNTFIA